MLLLVAPGLTTSNKKLLVTSWKGADDQFVRHDATELYLLPVHNAQCLYVDLHCPTSLEVQKQICQRNLGKKNMLVSQHVSMTRSYPFRLAVRAGEKEHRITQNT